MECRKLYVNVYSTSPEEEGAVICCTDHLDNWWNIFSHEGFLCNSKVCTPRVENIYTNIMTACCFFILKRFSLSLFFFTKLQPQSFNEFIMNNPKDSFHTSFKVHHTISRFMVATTYPHRSSFVNCTIWQNIESISPEPS
jgi:hypothetical protein